MEFEGWITDLVFNPKAKWTRNFTPPTEPFGKTSCTFEGDEDYLSIPDKDKDWDLSSDDFTIESWYNGRIEIRTSVIRRPFYNLKRLDYSDYYIISK